MDRVKVLNQEFGNLWAAYHGDCVEVVKGLPDESVGYSLQSPPFAQLYVYSNSERDMGNSKDYQEFCQHFAFLTKELFRVLKPGRLVSMHCMNIPTTIANHGQIGIKDFRGDIIRQMEADGFIYHSEVCIWKNAATEVQRTKTIGLLHKQMVKDSCMSRMALPDYVCTFRKPGKNHEPVAGLIDRYIGDKSTFKSTNQLSVDVWQRYASPVWFDINQTRTLKYAAAREENDERHICALQLDVIERCLELWSNEGDLVLSAFAGVGSEGCVAVENGRRFVGIELKESYWKHAVANLSKAEEKRTQERLFTDASGDEDSPSPVGAAFM